MFLFFHVCHYNANKGVLQNVKFCVIFVRILFNGFHDKVSLIEAVSWFFTD